MPVDTPNGIEVRWAGPGDRSAIAGLEQLAKQHYGERLEDRETLEAASEAWLDPKAGHALFVLALVDGAPAGFASIAVTPPARKYYSALYLKELFVSPEMRSRGVGHALLVFIAEFCVAENIERIDLTTAADNEAGIRFYEREGATVQRQKISLRFETESIEKLAEAGS